MQWCSGAAGSSGSAKASVGSDWTGPAGGCCNAGRVRSRGRAALLPEQKRPGFSVSARSENPDAAPTQRTWRAPRRQRKIPIRTRAPGPEVIRAAADPAKPPADLAKPPGSLRSLSTCVAESRKPSLSKSDASILASPQPHRAGRAVVGLTPPRPSRSGSAATSRRGNSIPRRLHDRSRVGRSWCRSRARASGGRRCPSRPAGP